MCLPGYFDTPPTLLFEPLSVQILMQIDTVARARARNSLSYIHILITACYTDIRIVPCSHVLPRLHC